ncbi:MULTISPECIES: matrixin family metalloprotease [unclassified Aeromicrobium]|uniref:matrixin family metalloprotease n=1 Tax=unclassified Aeromicrobium TaxID=2633570 RepID=UPI00396B18BA
MRGWWDRISGARRRRADWSRRAFEELEALDRAAVAPRDWTSVPSPTSPRRRRSFVLLGLVIAGTVVVSLLPSDPDPHAAGLVWAPSAGGGQPAPAQDARDERLATPPRVPEQGTYAFVRTLRDGTTPVTYDPCVPIHVEINPRTGGSDAVSGVEAALDEVQAATGLELVVDGMTERAPDFDAQVRTEDLRRPVLIAWSDESETPGLGGDVVGQGGSVAVEHSSGARYTTGQIALDGPSLAAMTEQERLQVIRHELGHVVGLDHVDDQDELMHPHSGPLSWGPGDRRGLALLGSGSCE